MRSQASVTDNGDLHFDITVPRDQLAQQSSDRILKNIMSAVRVALVNEQRHVKARPKP